MANNIVAAQAIEKFRAITWWSYSDLKWLDEKEALKANAARDRLLKDVQPEVNASFFGKKLHLGPLSPGCAQCARGTWTCGFFSSFCNAACFFCPGRGRPLDKKNLLSGDQLTFKKEKDFLAYIKKAGLTGVSFSGGECLIHFDRLIKCLRAVRRRFGNKIHLWIYTNGRLVDEVKLKKLKQAGLNEIRINISAERYNLRAVRLAARFIPTVTVEIPMIPEDYETLLRCLPRLKKAGCSYLNIHQIYATSFNYKELAKRGYTLLHGAGPTPPTLEPELTALKLLKAASRANIGLPINYCTWEYRNQVTGWSRRKRAAVLVKKAYEDITPSGYLRRISVPGSPKVIGRIARSLRHDKELSRGLWAVDRSSGELHVHPDLLNEFDFQKNVFIVRYFRCETRIGSRSIYGHRMLGREDCDLSVSDVRRLLESKNGRRRVNEGKPEMWQPEDDFERIREGFPKIY